jgi:hypothetical protein
VKLAPAATCTACSGDSLSGVGCEAASDRVLSDGGVGSVTEFSWRAGYG